MAESQIETERFKNEFDAYRENLIVDLINWYFSFIYWSLNLKQLLTTFKNL